MKDIDIIKLLTKNKMFDYELLINQEGYTIYYENTSVCYTKNPKVIYKAIKVLGGKNGSK